MGDYSGREPGHFHPAPNVRMTAVANAPNSAQEHFALLASYRSVQFMYCSAVLGQVLGRQNGNGRIP